MARLEKVRCTNLLNDRALMSVVVLFFLISQMDDRSIHAVDGPCDRGRRDVIFSCTSGAYWVILQVPGCRLSLCLVTVGGQSKNFSRPQELMKCERASVFKEIPRTDSCLAPCIESLLFLRTLATNCSDIRLDCQCFLAKLLQVDHRPLHHLPVS